LHFPYRTESTATHQDKPQSGNKEKNKDKNKNKPKSNNAKGKNKKHTETIRDPLAPHPRLETIPDMEEKLATLSTQMETSQATAPASASSAAAFSSSEIEPSTINTASASSLAASKEGVRDSARIRL
jgi:hypothetical protein